LSTTARAEVEGSDGALAATIDLSGARFVAASEVAADVTLLDGDAEVATYGFGVRSRQQPWLTVPGVLVAVVVLLAVAYAESFLRNLRRGKRRVGGMIGVVLAGAGIGVGLMGVAWLVASRIPGPASGAATVVLGGLAGLAAGLAALRTSRRRRILLRLR
jgi:serine/threonine-protein kinase